MKKQLTTILLLLLAAHTSFVSHAFGQTDDIPTVAFCEMVKHPRLYFNKQIRLTATLTQAYEGQYLSDDECALSHDEQIGVGYPVIDELQREARNRELQKMQNIEYGGRACVTIVGVLRNKPRRDFMWYHYRFDIVGFEDIAHVVVPYEGMLQAGTTYRATVRGDRRAGLSLVPPVRIQEHYALLIEWTNLKEFPALKRLRDGSSQPRIVFSVISDQIKQIDVMRWNRTIQCKIIRVE